MKNLNYLFNREYYNFDYSATVEEKKSVIDNCNKDLLDAEFEKKTAYYQKVNKLKENMEQSSLNDVFTAFQLTVQYPGVLIGLGYPHSWGGSDSAVLDNEVKLGFSFDYVTGLPVIPGSTVKGMLRSAFRNYTLLIQDILLEHLSGSAELSIDVVNALEIDMFGQENPQWGKTNSGSKHKAPSPNMRDVFFDAIIVGAGEGNNAKIIGFDTITKHYDEERNGLTSPIPLRMLKVLPETKFEFRFILHDSVLNNEITVDKKTKEKLIKELLVILGIGAKTNVGFGGLA